jgi:hypothetical protein
MNIRRTPVYPRAPSDSFLDDDDVVRLLRIEVEAAGSQSAFAKKHGLGRVSINKILTGARSPPKSVITALKLRRVYIPK